ncbi:MAG TPA: nitrate reductase [Vicinamibacterales bacterium]|nr:nitrate reductase [Vicinamibacterales bacterium]
MPSRSFSQQDAGVDIPQWVPSTCGLCSIGCGVEIGVAGGVIAGVRGRAGHPVNDGRLGPKGLNQYFANRHPSRATSPLIRATAGKLVPASWDEAMQLVVDQFNDALATEGPDAVAIYNSGQLLLEEYYTLGKIARGGLGIATIDANTRLCTATTASALMESFGADGPPGAYEDLEKTECIVLVGHNAAEQSTVLWMRILAAKQGPLHPKIIVIDPRRTLTVTTGADLHLALRPGTNVALLNGICNLLIENGTIDEQFIARHTSKFNQFREIVSRSTPDHVEATCGIPQAQLRTAADWIGRSKTTVTTCLQGVYQSNQATAAACAVNSMHLLMGKIGRPGCAPMQFAGQPSSMNTRETGADGTYPAYRNWEDQNHMRDLAKRWNVPVELLGKKPIGAPEIFELCEHGYTKVLWNIGTNPAVSMMNRSTHLRTLNGVFLIVQDCFADTETAQLADVVLPSAMWGEKTGCMTNAERRCTLLRKAVDPPGEARSDLEIFLDFSRRMNLRDRSGAPLIRYTDPEGAFNEWREVSRGCIPDYSGMTYEKLAGSGGIQWPCNDAHPDGTVRLYTDPHFPTEWQISESYEKDLETGHEHTLNEYRKKRDPRGRAVLVAADYQPPLDTTDDRFPLIAISGRQAYHWHTRTKTAKAPQLQEAAPAVFVAVNEADAEALGILDGDRVRIVSRRGSVVAPAKVGDVVPAGVVFVPFHYGDLGQEHAANNLMPQTWDPVSKQPVQKSAAVRLERIEAIAGGQWWQVEGTR